MIKNCLVVVVLFFSFWSCTVLQEYEKININDPDMVLQDKECDRNVTIAHSYREGSAGANGGKTGGGCGCN